MKNVIINQKGNATLKQRENQYIIKDKKNTLTLTYIKGRRFVKFCINGNLIDTYPVEKCGSNTAWVIENTKDRVTYELYVSKGELSIAACRKDHIIWGFDVITDVLEYAKGILNSVINE